MTAIAVALLASLSLFSWSQVPNASPGVYIPSYNGTLPNYFAGTANRASGTIYAYPPPSPEDEVYMTHAKLYLGSTTLGYTLVNQWDWIPGEPKTVTAGVGCVFDSTHFADQTSLHIVVNGVDNLGRTYQKSESVAVKNTALLGNNSFRKNYLVPPGCDSYRAVEARLAGRYAFVRKWESDLNLTAWKAALGGANVVYVTTHGTPDYYEMQNGAAFSDDPASDPDTHRAVLQSAIGTSSYPPYNASGSATSVCIR